MYSRISVCGGRVHRDNLNWEKPKAGKKLLELCPELGVSTGCAVTLQGMVSQYFERNITHRAIECQIESKKP